MGIIGTLLLSLSVLAPASAVAPSPGGAPGSGPLAAAAASLAHGGGPAAASLGPTVAPGASRSDGVLVAPSTQGYVWNNVTGAVGPGPVLTSATMAYDAADGYVVLFGGQNGGGVPVNQTWTYSNGAWTNLTMVVTGTPPPLYGASMAYLPSSGGVVLFGGIGSGGQLTNGTYLYAHGAWTNLTPGLRTAPSPRAFASLAYDSHDQELVLFGGRALGLGVWYADTWVFEAGVWVNLTSAQLPALPTIVAGAVLTDDPGTGVLLFGAAQWGLTLHASTYVLTNSRWQNLTGTLTLQPPAFDYGGGEYVTAANGSFLFGGWILVGGAPLPAPQTWEFAAGAWTNVTRIVAVPSGAPSELQGGTAYVTGDQSILSYGTAASNPYGRDYTWALATAPTVTINASARVTLVGQPIEFFGATQQGLAPNALLWNLGDGTTSPLGSVTHAYTAVGAYLVSLTATSLAGATATSSTIVQVLPTLSVSIVPVPAAPIAGSLTSFVGLASGGQGPYGFDWTFGDGGSSSAPVPTHTFVASGTYEVRVNVTDALGFLTHATLNVTVASTVQVPPSSPTFTSGVGLGLTIGLIVVAAIAVVLGVLLARGRPPRAAPTPYASPPGGSPPPAGPPPGAP
jgi:PKD repeat protein